MPFDESFNLGSVRIFGNLDIVLENECQVMTSDKIPYFFIDFFFEFEAVLSAAF